MWRVDVEYRTHFRVNSPRGWRQRVAHVLMRLAARVDPDRWHVAVELEAWPPLARGQQRECVKAGLEAMRTGFVSEVEAEAGEVALREARPDLVDRA